MFIYNIKVNGSVLFKVILSIIILIALIICGITAYKLYSASIKVNDTIKINGITELTNKNYTTILQSVHDNIDTYIGQKIKYSGFIYRVYDLDKEQFVLGRNMIISSDFQTVIVGFLSHYKDAISFKDSTWVEVEGEITKGTYHGSDMPILEIISIKQINKPNDEYVYPPDDDFIPTAYIL